MTLSAAEIESVRFHLGYGNVGIGALPYTADGYWSTFDAIVSVYLGTGTETSATTDITAGTTVAVTPLAMTGITARCQLVIDAAEQAEIVTVKAVTSTTFTAYFAKAHTSGYPISTMCGLARLRMLLHDADQAHRGLTDISIADSTGLKSVDKQDVVFQDGTSVQVGRLRHYQRIQGSISSLVRVPVALMPDCRSTTLEAY